MLILMGRAERGKGKPQGELDDYALRMLAGAGRTALTGDLARRARDVSRPSPADEAKAERDLVIRHGRVVEP